jgi:hypothetical protein
VLVIPDVISFLISSFFDLTFFPVVEMIRLMLFNSSADFVPRNLKTKNIVSST